MQADNKKCVLKFGGTSMGDVTALSHVCDILLRNHQSNRAQIVVCSAMSGTTDELQDIAQLAVQGEIDTALTMFTRLRQRHIDTANSFGVGEHFVQATFSLLEELRNLIIGLSLVREYSPRSTAHLLSYGERLSTRLLAIILSIRGVRTAQMDSVFVRTTGRDFLEDEVDWKETIRHVQKTILPTMEEGITPIVTGFFASNHDDQITLLGRGGSDYSAAILAVALDIEQVEIWTDVDGFMTADPRIVPEAKVINEIGYIEAAELCFFGARVLHPKTIRPVIDKGGSVFIKNTFHPEEKGTRISQHARHEGEDLIAVTSKPACVISLDLFGSHKRKSLIFSEVFQLAAQHQIAIDMIASSEALLSFCIEEKMLNNKGFLEELKNLAPVEISGDRKIICAVSPGGVQGQVGVAASLFDAFAREGISIEMYSQNNSEIAQLMVIEAKDADNGIRALHKKYI